MPPAARYDEPFHWWGPGWVTPARRGLAELLRDGTLDVETAAHLWAALARRRSLVVIGGPSGLGKSTLLDALGDLLPPETARLYPRGCFETFAFLDDPGVVPHSSVLLVNEISPHLPVYLWGPGVVRVLDAARRGFALLATAHGASVVEFVASLTGSPLRVPATQLAACEFVALLEPTAGTASGRGVTGLWRLQQTRHGLDVALICARQRGEPSPTDADPPEVLQALWPAAELAERSTLLGQLRDGAIDVLPVVSGAEPAAMADSAPDSATSALSHRPDRV